MSTQLSLPVVGPGGFLSRWQRIAVCFAGPLAGFVFLGGLLLALWLIDPEVFPFYLFVVGFDLGQAFKAIAVSGTLAVFALVLATSQLRRRLRVA